MSAPMSFQEFGNLLKFIRDNNSPLTAKYPARSIKYIDPVFDMRTNSVFAVSFRSFGSEDKAFHTQNECRDLPQSLDERIREWLATPLNQS